jgi:hypothetical protein
VSVRLLAFESYEHPVPEQIFAGAAAIELDSPRGAQLLAVCKDAAADPFELEAWLAALGPAAGDTSASAARTD